MTESLYTAYSNRIAFRVIVQVVILGRMRYPRLENRREQTVRWRSHMPGLIVCSWSADKVERARPLFETARTSFGCLQGVECTSEAAGPTYRLARFADEKSPHRDLMKSKDEQLVVAVAGWCFHPARPYHSWPSIVEELSAKHPGDRESILDRLQGQYAVAIADRKTGEVVVSGDQLGAFPLYTMEQDGIAWASTSAIVLAYAVRPRLDLGSLRALFMDDSIRSPRSVFEGIRRSPFGERHYLRDGKIRTRRVWSPFRDTVRRKLSDAVDEGIDLIEKSCQQMEEAWPRWVSDLTSGLDTRLLVAVAAKRRQTVHTTVNGSPQDVDVVIARRIAEKLRWPILHIESPEDWGHKRWAFFQRGVALADGEKPGQAIDRTIRAKTILRESYDAATGGSGGEFFRDFLWQQDLPRIGKTSEVNIPRLVRYMFTFHSKPDMNLFRSDWRTQYKEDLVHSIRAIMDLAPDALNTAKLDAIYLWKVSGHNGRYGGAAFPVIASPYPLLTADVVEYATTLSWKFRLRSNFVRYVVTRAHPELASMPTWHGGGARPITLGHPLPYAHYHINLGAKLVRKIGRLATKSSFFAPPTARHALAVWDTDFVDVLAREGFLEVENLITKDLYNKKYLREFMRQATREGFKSFGQLYTIVSVELICRLCDIVPEGQSF